MDSAFRRCVLPSAVNTDTPDCEEVYSRPTIPQFGKLWCTLFLVDNLRRSHQHSDGLLWRGVDERNSRYGGLVGAGGPRLGANSGTADSTDGEHAKIFFHRRMQ